MPELTSIADLLDGTDPLVEWVIHPMLPRRSCVLLVGDAGAGKSFLAYTLAMGLATGTTVLGWPTQPASILYFDQENSFPDCLAYLRKIWHGLGKPSLDLIRANFHLAHFQLGHRPTWQLAATELIHRVHPSLLIFDTATPCCDIQDENDNAEAARAVGAIRSLQNLTHAENGRASCRERV